MGLQAALLASAALTAEVEVLKKDMRRSSSRRKKVNNTSLNKYLTEKDFGCE